MSLTPNIIKKWEDIRNNPEHWNQKFSLIEFKDKKGKVYWNKNYTFIPKWQRYKEAKDWIKETKFPEYNCKIGWNANNEILLVTQNYFGGQRLKQEKEQELLGKIRKKIHQELNNIDRELKTGERSPQYSHEERENIKEYQEELKEGLSTKNYEELNEFSFTHLFNEELQQLGNIKEGGNNTSYDLSRSDIAILWKKQLYFISSFTYTNITMCKLNVRFSSKVKLLRNSVKNKKRKIISHAVIIIN